MRGGEDAYKSRVGRRRGASHCTQWGRFGKESTKKRRTSEQEGSARGAIAFRRRGAARIVAAGVPDRRASVGPWGGAGGGQRRGGASDRQR